MQTAISTKDKFRASLFGRHLREIGDFAQTHDAQLVVAPETAVPTTLRALTPAQGEFLERTVTPSRALEQQIPVLIAANGGPTAFIDAEGVIERELPRDTPGALEVTLRPRAGTTVYARYGNSFLYLVMTLAALLSLRIPLSTVCERLRRSQAK